MDFFTYFEQTKGIGILATADSLGRVDAAAYARPHFIDEKTCAFIMADKLTYKNLQSNPHAVYLFKEEKAGYRGKRLYLTKIRESDDQEVTAIMRRSKHAFPLNQEKDLQSNHIVFFKLDQVRPLVGDGKET